MLQKDTRLILYNTKYSKFLGFPIMLMTLENTKTGALSPVYEYASRKREPRLETLTLSDNSKDTRTVLVAEFKETPGTDTAAEIQQFYIITQQPSLLRCFVLMTREWSLEVGGGRMKAVREVTHYGDKSLLVAVTWVKHLDSSQVQETKYLMTYRFNPTRAMYEPLPGIQTYPQISLIFPFSYDKLFHNGGIDPETGLIAIK